MHKSYHIGTFILIIINVGFGLMLMAHNFDLFYLWTWGASSANHPAIQSLSIFPPFCLGNFSSGIMIKAISGTTLLIIRSIYASFLHFSLLHLASNMYALYYLGYMFEDLNYPGLLIPVYLITGSISMLSAGYYNPNTLTAGASGAIFGIMGVMIIMAIKARILLHFDKLDNQTAMQLSDAGSSTWIAVIQNLIITFTNPTISIPGHIGGLVAGLCLGLIIPIRRAD